MENLDSPSAIMDECETYLEQLNKLCAEKASGTIDLPRMQAHLADINLTFRGIASKSYNPSEWSLFLTNILFRAFAVMRLFKPEDFNLILSNALAGVGVREWKQSTITEEANETGN